MCIRDSNYILPFPKSHPKLARVAGGWAVNFQTTMQTGFPLAITQSNLNSAEGTGGQRPNATGISPVVDVYKRQLLSCGRAWIR